MTVLAEELVAAGVLPEGFDLEAHKELVPMQPGDVPVTYADTLPLERDYGFRPATPLRTGLRAFARWYKDFYLYFLLVFLTINLFSAVRVSF